MDSLLPGGTAHQNGFDEIPHDVLADLFSAHFGVLTTRYATVLQEEEFDTLVLHSGERVFVDQDDLYYPFFVHTQFKAVAPLLEAPDCWVIWPLGERPRLFIYRPDDFWHGDPPLPEVYWSHWFDIDFFTEHEQIRKLLGDCKNAVFLGECGSRISDWDVGARNPPAVIRKLGWYRSFKTQYEAACIAQANVLAARGHVAAKRAFEGGGSELEIAWAFEAGCGQHAQQLAYPSVVGANRNAAILHYGGRDRRRRNTASPGSLLIDAGATCHGYASDVSRTYAQGSEFFVSLIELVHRQQKRIVSKLQVGANYVDLTIEAYGAMARVLHEAGVLRKDPRNAFETGVLAYFMPHGLGHFIGLQVHDVGGELAGPDGRDLPDTPRLKGAGLRRNVEPGQVVTVEPGVYFIDPLLRDLRQRALADAIDWRVVDKLMPFGGVRIEDNILVTEEGPKNLTCAGFEKAAPAATAPI